MTRPGNRSPYLTKLPTGVQTFVLLGLALLPLGLVAVFTSVDQASNAREKRYAEVSLLAEIGARHLSQRVSETETAIRSALDDVQIAEDGETTCPQPENMSDSTGPGGLHLTILSEAGGVLCAPAGAAPLTIGAFPAPNMSAISIDEAREAIIVAHGMDGGIAGVATLSRRSLALLPRPALLARNYQIALSSDEQSFIIRAWNEDISDNEILDASSPIGGTGFVLTASFQRRSLTAGEIFSITLPILMWAVAALLGWLAISQLLIRPLTQLRHAVIRHADGEAEFDLPQSRISAIEIQQLAEAFETAFVKLQSHEEQLAVGLAEQTRLTREVHHRVKNNLQIIASLLSLHARAAKSDDSAAAYASIQRRVDALAIVQRNLFAELHKDAGLALRPVIAELASGLQQSAPPTAELGIAIDVDDVRVGQDIAAPVAFLVTELVELAMLCGNRVEIAISVTALADNHARLAIRSPALATASERDEFSRYRRVLTGMARQLQASLDEAETGTLFTIMIPTF
ncbi:MAG: sensor histidine kinase [Pseudomonadota bacterium]